MASIDIFPISIGGVQPPLNLLTTILAPNAGTTNLFYPIDLTSNPSYCHAIQFTVYDYDTPNLSQAVGSLYQAYNASANQQTKDGKTNYVDQVKSFVTNSSVRDAVSTIATGAAAKIQTTKALAYISLYMPDTLNTTYDSDYTTLSLTETMGLYGIGGGLLADEKSRRNLNPTNLVQSRDVQAVGAALAGQIPGIGGGVTGLINRALKNVPNPQMQLIYKGISLREFQFEFIFTPVSSQEAQMVDQIIKKFTYFSLPEATPDQRYLIPPQIFKINFSYTGSSGLSAAVTNVFNNTLTNVLGSQVSAALFGGNPTDEITNSTSKAKLFSIGDCVLTNINVDYAPNGWAAYNDGYPVQTRLTLQFQEMEIQTKAQVDPNFYSSQNGSVNAIDQANINQATRIMKDSLSLNGGFL